MTDHFMNVSTASLNETTRRAVPSLTCFRWFSIRAIAAVWFDTVASKSVFSGNPIPGPSPFDKSLECGSGPFQAPDDSTGDRSVTHQVPIVDLCQDGLAHPARLPDLRPR